MSDSMEQFKVVFFEECAELLISLEEGLMQLHRGDSDDETIHAVFRAVHSIKGGAGAFGFDRLVAFAHIQETLLDEMRSGTIEMKPDYIEVLLQAYDILSELVGAAQRNFDMADDFGADAAQAMQTIMATVGASDNADQGQTGDENTPPTEDTPQDIKTRQFSITFKPYIELYQRANEPILLIRELGDLGELTVELDTSDMPALDEMHGEHAYFSWKFNLVTEFDENAILEVFEFVEGDCELEIKDISHAQKSTEETTSDAVEETAKAPTSTDTTAQSVSKVGENSTETVSVDQGRAGQSGSAGQHGRGTGDHTSHVARTG